ncbi:lycopene beta-cyclase [Nonlabens xylanidelens]|uniref:Lycopene beta-cyclase n=1 Tax=Nonlabens xylanidelens TaxID=191564 RepID=A0A2S6IFS7_9FLAO|nr:lycopene cyclase family protein [Nonlabens xylanidelens]PPK93047.1 lycopene beta-cyclase [Nonlabens xylanidelens]PQJ18748.1 lycopene cyclase [Nonlabens xylanidelens]
MDSHYDIAIIGMGCAGSHIVQELLRRKTDLNIVIIDDFKALSLDKTWSFWEKGNGKWDHLISHSWKKGSYIMPDDFIPLDLDPYVYKTIESRDFIAFAKAELQQKSNYTLIEEKVQSVSGAEIKKIVCEQATINASIVLDSRIDPKFFKDTEATTLQQHFKGWVIKTERPTFDPEVFTMMDYRLRDAGTTSFTYVLPYSTTQALVEFTYFSKDVVSDDTYEKYLQEYIAKYLQLTNYSIEKTEQGVIPMTSYKFEQHHRKNHLKIGTAGGWVKPSTGYSFKMSEKKAVQLVDNIILKRELNHGMISKKFRFYDDIMLDVLHSDNARGPEVFHTLYRKNKIQTIFSFLDQETSLSQELGIMLPMTSVPFLSAFFKKLF